MKWLKKVRQSCPRTTASSSIPAEILVSPEHDGDGSATNNDNNKTDRRPSTGSNFSASGHPRPKCVPSAVNNNLKRAAAAATSQSPIVTTEFGTGRPSVSTLPNVSSSVQELATTPSGKCPFRHGTVYAGPYPGYTHGNPSRGICPNGCRATPNADITVNETPKQTLLREALEYIELYYHEREDDMQHQHGFVSKEKRMEEVKTSIEERGTYEHTFDELQHGARVAWRNAPKCSNRKYWQQLKLLDCRDVTTNKGMFDCCINHLAMATNCGSSEAYVTVFKPKPPLEDTDGPRIWNEQLLQYASYRLVNENGQAGEVIGDPKNLRFTEMLKERFGWNGPPDGKQGAYDYLPLVVQADPNKPPEMFDVPIEVAPPVYIHHPQYPELSSLNMQWYPIPAVCALDMSLGGITYTAVPFNGWYASTEVLRDLTDKSRYNMLVPVAKALGMDADTKPGEAPLWIDDVMAILNKAVFHSFKTAKIAMIDHHNLINMFWDWYHDEMKSRSYCPCNWKWVIPPMSSSTSPAYLGLNKAQEYTLKPAYIIGKGFIQLETSHFGPRDRTKAVNDLIRTMYLALLFKRMVSRYKQRKQPVLIIYASVTGNAANYAYDLGAILSASCNVTFFDACSVNASKDGEILSSIESSTLTIFVSSTQGNGELPSLARKFFSFLFDDNGHVLLRKHCAVLGFGSSAYPIFCGGGKEISRRLSQIRAKEIIPRGECDAVKGESPSFYKFTSKLVEALASVSSASALMVKLSKELKENNTVSIKRGSLEHFVSVQVFHKQEVEDAAAKVYLMRRKGSASRRISNDSAINKATMRASTDSSIPTRRASTDSSIPTRRASTDSSIASCANTEEETARKELIMKVVSNTNTTNLSRGENVLVGQVTDRFDLISSYASEDSDLVTRKTALVKINLESCGNPPYQPGDHVQVFPHNVVSIEKLELFIGHLAGDLSLDSHIYVAFNSEEISRSELAVALPLLSESLDHMTSVEYFFEKQVALLAPISMQACQELAALAPSGKDKIVLDGLSKSATEYERMNSLTGLKWIDLFKTFPSLTKLVSISFLLCNMKMNHPRSYSISSCKAMVGSELHLCVGRFIYSRGGSTIEAGICSNFLTSVEPGDEIHFKLESVPSFHHPLDPSCPVIFICTGTGIAPIRGLLMKRSYFKSRGERLGPTFLIFGSRCSEEGLFHEEIKQFQKNGVLTKTWMCYSREPGKPKEYTGDKLGSDRVKTVLSPIVKKTNTHVYLCGSANMAEQSKAILMKMSSKACVAKMTATGRLHCDVFGALSSSETGRRKKNSTFCCSTNSNKGRASQTWISTKSLEINGDDWLSDEDLFEESGGDSSIPPVNRRESMRRTSSLVLYKESSGKRQQEMIDLLRELDPEP